MNAGAGIVEQDEAAALAICREFVDGEEVAVDSRLRYRRLTSQAFGDQSFYFEGVEHGGLARRRDATRERRPTIWAVHELRDMGHLSRDLVETAGRFAALHLQLEPRAKCALRGDGVGGGTADPHRALLKRTALAEHVDDLYAAVAKKLDASDLAVFAMAFDPSRPSVSDIKAAALRDFAAVCRIIESGLTKLWAREPIILGKPFGDGDLITVPSYALST